MKILFLIYLILFSHYKIEASEESKLEINCVDFPIMNLETPLVKKKIFWNEIKHIQNPELTPQKIDLILSISLDPRATMSRQKKMIQALERLDPTLTEETRKIWISISQKKRKNKIKDCIWAARHITVLTQNLNHSPFPTQEVNEAWERVAVHPLATLAHKIEAGDRSYTKVTWQAVYEDKDAKDYHKSEALRRIRMIEQNISFY